MNRKRSIRIKSKKRKRRNAVESAVNQLFSNEPIPEKPKFLDIRRKEDTDDARSSKIK